MHEVLRLPQHIYDFLIPYMLQYDDDIYKPLLKNAIERKMIVPYPPEMHEQVLREGYCIMVPDENEVET